MKNYRYFVAALLLIAFVSWTHSYADGIVRIEEDGNEVDLPLVSVDVEVEIHDQVALTTVRNSFVYDGDSLSSGMYFYRLPAEASVTSFGIWRGERFVEYELRPGDQGDPGGGPGEGDERLIEFLGSNFIATPIDTLEPGLCMIQMKYVELLPYDFGTVEYAYPLSSGEFLVQTIDTVQIDVTLQSQRTIETFEAKTYEGITELELEDDFNGLAALRGNGMEPRQDFAMRIVYSQEDIGAWLLTHRSDPDSSGYFLLMIEPGIVDTVEAVRKYFTFVLDRSGSMSGEKIAQAKTAVLNCLEHLLPNDFFNVIDFASDVNVLDNEMLRANDENLRMARRYIDDIHADLSTNIYEALMTAVSQNMGEGAANQVILTTDGLPTAGEIRNPSAITRAVTEANRFDARIFSFGIGEDVNVSFLTDLSDRNDGLSIFFDPEEARIDSIISHFYTYIARPALVNPEVQIDEQIEVENVYPPELQDVSAGKQLYLAGRYGTFGSVDVLLTGQMANGDTTLTFNDMVFPEEEAGNAFVPRMWAKSVIDYWLKWMQIHGEDDEIIDMIIELSLQYGILTPYTEFGNPDDPEDPGGEDSLSVFDPVIAHFNALRESGGLSLSWSITGVASAVEFNVYRSTRRNGQYRRLNDRPLPQPWFVDEEALDGVRYYYKVEVISGEASWTSDAIEVGHLPAELTLDGPYPNPFNDQANVMFYLAEAGRIESGLYDARGRRVRSIVDDEMRAGTHLLRIDGGGLAAGNYLLRVKVGEQLVSKAVVLVK